MNTQENQSQQFTNPETGNGAKRKGKKEKK
jgi:hypothetical protein